MNFEMLKLAFYTLRIKPSEDNSDNKNVYGDRKKQAKYAFLAIENVSEKSNNLHMFCRNTDMKIK